MAKTTMKPADAILTVDVRELPYVNDDSGYYVTIQVGQSTRWRQYSGGCWVPDTANQSANPDNKAYRHVPAIYERIGPLTGETVNGLISGHNKWRSLNSSHKRGGEIQHQLLVLAVEETPDETKDVGGTPPVGKMIRSIVRETVLAVMEELTKK